MFPQGHGDAYGHYLTALTGYYKLLASPHFTWTPRTESVDVLGQTVQIDYQDERKFAAAAASVARIASRVLNVTARKSYRDDPSVGWSQQRDGKYNSTTGITRRWGTDEWAARGGQGAYFNWVSANAMLLDKDTNPAHTGIQISDRTTVPELSEIVSSAITGLLLLRCGACLGVVRHGRLGRGLGLCAGALDRRLLGCQLLLLARGVGSLHGRLACGDLCGLAFDLLAVTVDDRLTALDRAPGAQLEFAVRAWLECAPARGQVFQGRGVDDVMQGRDVAFEGGAHRSGLVQCVLDLSALGRDCVALLLDDSVDVLVLAAQLLQ